MDLAVVITSVQAPTPSVRAWLPVLARHGATLFVVGDAVGPADYPLDGVRFLSFDAQRELPFELARVLPAGHYARKNLGYLAALQAGAARLYETDDDNAPGPGWAPRARNLRGARPAVAGWVNSFAAFTDGWIWPRGLPLERAGLPGAPRPRPCADAPAAEALDAPVQQGLVDGEPDVDAVWRLLHGDRPAPVFRRDPPLACARGSWTPINSQSTWWWRDVAPLLYLPSTCSFRLTDIQRGLVALPCVWALGGALGVHAPEVVQDRNPHDLLRDLEQELPAAFAVEPMARTLAALELAPGLDALPANQRRCWQALVDAGFVDPAELPRLDAWQRDVARLG